MATRFSKSPQKRNRERARIQRRGRYNAAHTFITEMMGGVCVKCGSSKRLCVSYIGPGKKPRMNWRSNIVKLMAIGQDRNYILLCGLCWAKSWKKRFCAGTIKHGTVSGYSSPRSKCRCTACRAAWNEYSKKWHKQKYKKRRAVRELLNKGKFNFLKH